MGFEPAFRQVRRFPKKIKEYEADTQQTREELIQKLLSAVEIAHQYAMDPSVPDEEKLKAARVCAYLAQRINKILKDYDDIKIQDRLNELEERLDQLKAKRGFSR